eukprot:CAMPEP_0194233858 /NCGR_PEP_ID=MMETSP0158-20130606/1705_1 /TAXON_ID=33649 /ORGANISM="Thalassionema nitzschioides, Strain L26-B" /LENGTH=472 /DNA_ID=CAMNT_0038966857 /DNA_START=38 /DNA_END=1456 /DNA_ORIENTATION=-
MTNSSFILLMGAIIFSAPTTLAFNAAVMSPLFAHVASKPTSHHSSQTNIVSLNPTISNTGLPVEDLAIEDEPELPIPELEIKQPQKKEIAYKVPASFYNDNINEERYCASDWIHNMKTLHNSTILKQIKGPILTITIWSSMVSLVHQVLLRNGFVKVAANMCMSGKAHSFLVSALGLLLVFRTNSAYQRFSEGRKIWEEILSVSRNLSRMTNLYQRDIGLDCKKRIYRLLSSFPYLLRHHIQPQCLECKEQTDELNAILLPEASECHGEENEECWVDRDSVPWSLLPDIALRKCVESGNRPLWICDRMAQEFTNVAYTPNFTSRERLGLLGHVDKLSKCVGACERIHQTAVPLNYARHSLRSLTVWLWTLPFAVISESFWGGLLVGPTVGAIAWVLLGVYQIGCNIEDPFQGTLRLNLLCNAVYRDILYTSNIEQQHGNPRDSAFSMEGEEKEEWNSMEQTLPELPLVGVSP